jgi:hypothetical protein
MIPAGCEIPLESGLLAEFLQPQYIGSRFCCEAFSEGPGWTVARFAPHNSDELTVSLRFYP